MILSDDKVRAFVAAAYGLDDKFGLLSRHAGSHRRAAIAGRPVARRGSARSSCATEADDAEVRQGWRQKPQREESRSAIQCRSPRNWPRRLKAAAKGRARRRAAAVAKRRKPLGQESGAALSSPRGQGRHRNRARSCRGDDVRLAAQQHRPDAAAKRADQARGVACTTPASR